MNLVPESDPGPALLHDPWRAIFHTALAGQRDMSLAAMQRLEGANPHDDRSRLYAVSARALWVLGLDEFAARAMNRALTLGGPDAAALATVAHTDGRHWGAARLQVGSPGQQADAACDLAWLSLREGDLGAAERSVNDAVQCCPDHAEASRWARLLAESGRAAINLARGIGADDEVAEADALELFPRPELGWFSEERGLRRFEALSGLPSPAPRTALWALREAGCVTRVFAMDADYCLVGDRHPLVACEVQADRALSLEVEGRPAGAAATALWRAAARVDPVAVRDAAGLLVALGVREESCLGVGLLAGETLCREEPNSLLWQGYQARLLAHAGREPAALKVARAVIARKGADPMSWMLAIHALRIVGCHREARRFAEEGSRSPTLASTAVALLGEWDDPKPLVPVVSNRMRRRFPHLG